MLLGAGFVAGAPRLPGARCTEYAVLFDSDAGEPRHQIALALCGSCPARVRCRSWAEAQPPGTLRGVIGGHLLP